MFNSYRISRDNLLSNIGDVNKDGVFVSRIKDPKKRLGASLGSLSSGRVNISGMANVYMINALTIAIRHSAARRQFGPENGNGKEVPVLEYQSQQYRLLPHLAAAYVMKVFAHWLSEKQFKSMIDTYMKVDQENGVATGVEIHALSSAIKPVCTWMARDAIQDCRESCGGHGYLKC